MKIIDLERLSVDSRETGQQRFQARLREHEACFADGATAAEAIGGLFIAYPEQFEARQTRTEREAKDRYHRSDLIMYTSSEIGPATKSDAISLGVVVMAFPVVYGVQIVPFDETARLTPKRVRILCPA